MGSTHKVALADTRGHRSAPELFLSCAAGPGRCNVGKRHPAEPSNTQTPLARGREDLDNVAHQKLIDARQHYSLGEIGVDRQPVLGVGGENKFSPTQTQQVIQAHQPQNPLVVYTPPLPH